MYRGVIALCSVLLWSSSVLGQVASELRGQVRDASGASVAGAQLRLTEESTKATFATTTDAAGFFDFPELVPGRYDLESRAAGFRTETQRGIVISIGGTVNVPVALAVGGASDHVDVNSTAPALQSQTSDIQMVIPATHIAAIPLNSRNFINLAQLAPGVELPPGTLLPRINGGRPRTNEYLYDGISALQPEPGQVAFFPILDDIAEFAVEANNVSAEFGRFNGGVVNVSTRYGTNAFHGSFFEYLRNEALNARNFFAPTGRKPEYRRNLYGGTIGGPILRDRLFFFGDYQGIKQAIGVTRISTVPTTAQRAGNFGSTAIYDPSTTAFSGGVYTRKQFPSNTINVLFDPAAKGLLARIPLPTSNAATNNYSRTANDIDHQNQFDFRLDFAHGTSDHAFARYTYYNEVEQPVTPFPDGSGAIAGAVLGTGNVTGLSNVLGQQVVVNETHTFTPHLLNDARAGYTRRANYLSGNTVNGTAGQVLGIPGIPVNAAFNDAVPTFTFSNGFGQIGAPAGAFTNFQTSVYQLVDTVLFNRGAHTIKTGVDIRWYQLNAVAPPSPTGSFAFTNTGTDTQATGAATGGNAFASFLLGQVDTFSIDLQTSIIRPRDHIEGFFVQDDWRVTPQMTLNLGVRWDIHNPSTEKTNQGAVFNLSTQKLDYLGVNGNPRSARETHYLNFAPRVGLAYSLSPRTVIRSGFGMVFIDQSGITTPFTTPQFPFIQNVLQRTQDSINAPFTLASGPTVAPIALTPDAGLGQSVYTADRNAGPGYVQQWNLAVQRALTNSLSLEVAYVGSHIVHVGIPDSSLNQLTATQLAAGLTNPASLTGQVTNPYFGQIPVSSTIGGKTVAAAQLLKPYPRFQNVAIYRHNSGTTNFNGLEVKAEQRVTRGLTFTVAYTHSKLIDDASSVFSSTVLSSPNSSSLVAADVYRPYLERDSSSGDMPNVEAVSVVYALPAGRDHRFASGPVMDRVFGGWTVNSLYTAQSGMPVTVTQTTNFNSFAGFVTARPNYVKNAAIDGNQRTVQHWFNNANSAVATSYQSAPAFSIAPQFTIGNASRNPVRGPAFRDLDLSLIKHTRITEGTDLEFRAELFNLTNTPAFAQPNGVVGNTAFGTIAATVAEERVAQFALRFSY
jgi:carboxypeptidase family protein